MEALHELVAQNGIMISAIILLLAYVFIALEKIPKVTIALFGGVLTILLGLISQDKMIDGAMNPLYFINFVDFNVIFLLVSMMIIVSITAKTGVFSYLANNFLKMTKGHPIKILVVLGIFTAVVSAFLDNVTTVILIMPITFAIAKKLEINPIPFLITEIFCSNIGGTATLIGDPPNIIIGSAAQFGFMQFMKYGVVVVFISLVLSSSYIYLRFLK